MSDLVKQLAEMMNVSEADAMDHANLIANELKRDKVQEFFVNCDDQTGCEMVQTYSKAAVNTIEKITTAYLTKPAVKQWTQDAVLANLQGRA